MLTEDVVKTRPAERNPTILECQYTRNPCIHPGFVLTATEYISCEADATTMMIPTIQHSMYAMAHQAKFGKGSLISEMIEAMNAMSHASWGERYNRLVDDRRMKWIWSLMNTHSSNRNGGQGKWISNNVAYI